MAFVLVIDDDSNVRYGLENLLESAGHRTAGLESAEEFLSSHLIGSVDCLILDVNMPAMNGLDLQRALQDRGFRMPIIFVTAHSDQETKARAVKGGAIAFFGKPVQENDLLDSIAAAVQGKERS
jgi:FixJ family two-component response regulator